MTTYNPIFRSPISTPEPAAAASDLKVGDRTGIPVTLIQGDASDLLGETFSGVPANPGDVVNVKNGYLARLTLAEFYLFGRSTTSNLPSAAVLNDSFVQAKRFAHAVDLTHSRAALKLAGPAVGEALSKICGLDFHDSVFANMQVKQTSAAKIKALIVRCDDGSTPVFYVHVNRPFGQYFWDTVWDAGQELGVVVG